MFNVLSAFVFLAGHASLISHLVMYFPDVMRRLFKKNPGFEDDVKWALRFTTNARLVNEEKTAEILKLVSVIREGHLGFNDIA